MAGSTTCKPTAFSIVDILNVTLPLSSRSTNWNTFERVCVQAHKGILGVRQLRLGDSLRRKCSSAEVQEAPPDSGSASTSSEHEPGVKRSRLRRHQWQEHWLNDVAFEVISL